MIEYYKLCNKNIIQLLSPKQMIMLRSFNTMQLDLVDICDQLLVSLLNLDYKSYDK